MHDARERQRALLGELPDLLGRELRRERRARGAVVLEEGERLLVVGDQRVVGVDGEIRQAAHEREHGDVVDVDGVRREGGEGGEQALNVLLLAVMHDARRVEVDARAGLSGHLPGPLVLLRGDDAVLVRLAAEEDAVGACGEGRLCLAERVDGDEEVGLLGSRARDAVGEFRLWAMLTRFNLLEAQRVERFDGLAASLVDLAHRHHDLALDIAVQALHLIDAGAEAADLLADNLLRQRALARALADEVGPAFPPMPLCIAEGDSQGLTDGGADRNRDGDAAHRSARRIRLFRALHQPCVVDLEDAVVVTHGRGDGKGDGVARLPLLDCAPFRIGQGGDSRRHAAADLDPEVDLVAEAEAAAELHGDDAAVPVVGRDAADEQATVVRAAVAHHRLARASLKVGRREVAVEDLREIVALFLRDGIALARIVRVDGLAVGAHDGRDVLGALHATLDLERRDAGLDEVGDDIDRAEVARREQVGAGLVAEHVLPLLVDERVRQAAGLRAAAAVAAAAADHAAHQALARVADAERAVHERLDLDGRMGADMADLLERELAREHDAREAELRERFDALEAADRHLRARVERQVGHRLMGDTRDAEVLHEHGVGARLVEEAQVVPEGPHFLVCHDRVDRHVDGDLSQVCEVDGLAQRLAVEVTCVGARAEGIARQIDGIRAVLHRRNECLAAAGGC